MKKAGPIKLVITALVLLLSSLPGSSGFVTSRSPTKEFGSPVFDPNSRLSSRIFAACRDGSMQVSRTYVPAPKEDVDKNENEGEVTEVFDIVGDC